MAAALDADVLIDAAVAGHAAGMRVRALFDVEPVDEDGALAGCGSVLLPPGVLSKPRREGAVDEVAELSALLGRIALRPTDHATAQLATTLGAAYGLRAADPVHLVTAVAAGADRFVTSNERDLPKSISEIDITSPRELPDRGVDCAQQP
jgi:predicted nucleic acid-binding protein